MNKLLFETMDLTESDMVSWTLEGVGIPFVVTGRTNAGTEWHIVPMQTFVEEKNFQEAYELIKSRGLLKAKKKRRRYSREELHWVWYMLSFVPICLILIYLLSSFTLFTLILFIIYLALGRVLFKRYEKRKLKIVK